MRRRCAGTSIRALPSKQHRVVKRDAAAFGSAARTMWTIEVYRRPRPEQRGGTARFWNLARSQIAKAFFDVDCEHRQSPCSACRAPRNHSEAISAKAQSAPDQHQPKAAGRPGICGRYRSAADKRASRPNVETKVMSRRTRRAPCEAQPRSLHDAGQRQRQRHGEKRPGVLAERDAASSSLRRSPRTTAGWRAQQR